MMNKRQELLNFYTPTRYTLCFNVIVEAQVFVVGPNVNLSTEVHTSKLFKSRYNESISFSMTI
jgi:hypothetical protein